MNNEKLISGFIEFKKVSNSSNKGKISETTIDLYKKILTYVSNHVGKDFKDFTEEDILDYLKKLDGSKRLVVAILKMFYRYINNLDNTERLPDCIRRIKISNNVKNDIDYRERIISEYEYNLLIENSYKPIYKALIECLWITGARKSAIREINVDDVWYDGKFTRVVIRRSKTKPRELVYSGRAEHLLEWVESLHPFKDRKGTPLFFTNYGNNGCKRIGKQYIHETLSRITKRSGINRKITAHDFRHTKTTNLLKDGVADTFVKEIMGFTKNTDMLKIYDHNKLKDYEEYLTEKMEIDKIKPTYELLEKKLKYKEEEHEREIKKIKEALGFLIGQFGEDILNNKGEIDMKGSIDLYNHMMKVANTKDSEYDKMIEEAEKL